MGGFSTSMKRKRPVAWTSKPLLSSDLEGSGSCSIDEAHERGITLHQLSRLNEYTRMCCQQNEWNNGGRQSGFLLITVSEINLYLVVERVVKPLTKKRECSYVEFAGFDPEEQMPRWFVSHYWGEPIESFMACLELFHARHSLKDSTAFWICAYALRQHQLEKEIGRGDPLQEAFAKAIKCDSVEGTVTILDEKMEAYKRAWCCFEATLTIGIGKPLDLVVSQTSLSSGKRKTYMIVDRPAGPAVDKAEALDAAFPQKVAEEGMRVEIELSTASDPNDRNRILNCIAHETVSLKAPPLHHSMYDHYNEMLRKKFAAIVLRVATANGDADGVYRALHRSPTSHLVWLNVHGQSQQLEIAQELAARNPNDQSRQDIVAYFEQASDHTPNLPSPILESFEQPACEGGESVCSSVFCRKKSESERSNICHMAVEGHKEDAEADCLGRLMVPPRHRMSICSMMSTASVLTRFLDEHNGNKGAGWGPSESFGALPSQNFSQRGSSQPASRMSLVSQAIPILPSGFASRADQQGRRKSRCHSDPPLDMLDVKHASRSLAKQLSFGGEAFQAPKPGLNHSAKQWDDILHAGDSKQLSDSSRQLSDSSRAGDSKPPNAAPSAGDDELAKIIGDVLMTKTDPQRLEESLRRLGALAAVNVSFQNKACAAGAVKAVLESMKGPHGEVGVQREACHALWSLIFNSEQHAKEAINHDARAAINMVLERYSQDSRLLQEGRRALGEMLLAEETVSAKHGDLQKPSSPVYRMRRPPCLTEAAENEVTRKDEEMQYASLTPDTLQRDVSEHSCVLIACASASPSSCGGDSSDGASNTAAPPDVFKSMLSSLPEQVAEESIRSGRSSQISVQHQPTLA